MTRPNIARGQQVAAEVMNDEARIDRPSTTTILNETTGQLAPGPTEWVWSGPCRVRPFGDRNEQTPTFGHEAITVTRYEVWLPVDCPAIRIGDIVTVECTSDPQLELIRLRVLAVPLRTHLTRRTLSCELID